MDANMHLFKDEKTNRFYTTNEYIDGLKKIHITTIDRALRVHNFFNPMVLLDRVFIYEDKDGLLTTDKPEHLLDEAYYSISITKHLTLAQVAHQSLKTLSFEDQAVLISELEGLWESDCKQTGEALYINLRADDDSKIAIKLNNKDKTYNADLSAGGLTIDGYKVKPYHVSDPFVIEGWVYQ